MLKLERLQECTDLLVEVKPTMQRDAFTLVYLVKIYEALHQDSEVIKILESVQDVHSKRADLGELLFCAYAREGKILKQQN